MLYPTCVLCKTVKLKKLDEGLESVLFVCSECDETWVYERHELRFGKRRSAYI